MADDASSEENEASTDPSVLILPLSSSLIHLPMAHMHVCVCATSSPGFAGRADLWWGRVEK
jgi:hypothetical protein